MRRVNDASSDTECVVVSHAVLSDFTITDRQFVLLTSKLAKGVAHRDTER